MSRRHTPPRDISLPLKIMTWINICFQVSFPLAMAFTPSFAGAGSDGRFLLSQKQTNLQTRAYTLGEGETVNSVAEKYNMSLDSLRKLNQFRIFARGFEHLQQGDELEVPTLPLPKIHWDDTSSVSTSASKDDDIRTQKLASYVSQLGGVLGNDAAVDATASMARGIATGAAGGEIQQWLSHFGTARVQLDVDNSFSFKNSQFDLLVPLYEQEDRLIFTQGSLHRTDDRTQSNLGFGYRWFAGNWMLGANTFLDYDLSRGHTRMGLGGEYWRDFLKLGVNTYHRLTGWKNSPDLEDYEERPANGWDLRAQYWIPSLPQLGGKLTYEQYYGDEVALFGRDNRQRNPHAVTAGVNYTPVPLLTFSAEQRQGQSGKSDTRFGVDMNLQFNVPWQHQINPDAVATMRRLDGSKYDLVERNNNIVLEYRKKEVIRLKTADLVTGYAGEQKSLGVSVNSKYGLERIDWSASPLVAAGGKIEHNAQGWTVVMPAYHSGVGAVNSYTVSSVAIDKKGNVSDRAETQVTVTQAAIDTTTSSLSPPAATLPADGTSQQEFVLKVNDKEGHPVDITENEISVEKTSKLRGNSEATVSSFTRRAAGEFVMTVTSGTMPEEFTITPSARNTKFASTEVKLIADNATAMVNALDVVEDNAIADGQSQNKLRLTVVDAQNNPVHGQSVSLLADNNATVAESAITEADGTVIVPVTSLHAGDTTITASINNKGSKTQKLSFRPDQNTARIEQKDVSVLPEISVADGEAKKTVTARVIDANGNAVPDIMVTFSADNNAVLAEEKVKTDNQGMVTTTLTSTVAGISRVVASVNSQSTSKETTFTGNHATAIVTSVDTTSASGVADGSTAVTFRALIKDQNGNPLSGIPVDWKSDKDSSIVAFNHTQTVTSVEGIAEARVTSTRAYRDVVVTASTNASSKAASPFTFVADKQNPVIQSFSSNKPTLTANGKDTAELTISVTDTNGNPLSGVEVAFSNGNNAKITPSHPVTNANGVVSANLSTLHAGQVTVSASLNKGDEKSLTLTAVSDEQTAGVTVTAPGDKPITVQTQPVILTATVIDQNKNPVSGTTVTWQTSHNQLSETVTQTNAEGKAMVKLTGTQAVLSTVTAVLNNGQKGSAQVTFGPGEPVGEYSQLSVSPQSITADGTSEALASLILRDKWKNPVPGKTIDWSADKPSGIQFAPVEKGDGVYQAAVKGTAEGIWVLNAQSGTVDLQTSLALLASQDTAQIDSVVVTGADKAKADGQEYVTIRTQVKDKNGNTKLKGVAVGWSTTLGTLSSGVSTTDENGVAEMTLSSRAAGSAWVSAMLGGGSPVKASKAVSFTAGDLSAEKSGLSLSPASIIASKENATLTVTARDAQGNLLSGLKDKINADFTPDLNMTVSAFSEVSPGIYEASVSGKKAGTTQVSADVSNVRINHTASLTLNADNDTAKVKGNISVTPSSARVGEKVTYTAVLTDLNENALGAGIPVTWSANEGSMLSAQMTRTDDSGAASVTLSRQLAGTAKVELILPSSTTPAPDAIFTAGEVDETRSELTLAPSTIVAGKETATLTLTLRDSNGNLLTGKSVSGHSDNNGNVSISDSKEDNNAPGHYTMTVTSDKAGSATLSVKVGGNTLNKSRILTVKGDTDSWKLSAVTSDKASLTAGDAKGVTYSATVTDAKGNPLNNVVVSWQLRGQAESYTPTSRTNEQGVATTTVKSHTTGLLQMTAYLDADNYIQAKDVAVLAGDIKNATFGADKTIIGSDGKDTVTLVASLEDAYGNPITGKKVSIEGADSLKGFNLSAVQDQQNGRYKATGTSKIKGQVTLNAVVGGEKMGDSVTVTVGAITPDLRFDNANQSVTWTKHFTTSQSVKGMPEELEQNWSSSNRSVAIVGNDGKVTLLKAGKTRISVYTPGNEQYNQAMASYEMDVAKASPGLKAGTGDPVTAVWADGKERNITATYTNSDVQQDELKASYSVKSEAVVTVSNTGKLTPVKPGVTTVTVSTPETEQFLAASAEVAYVLNKAQIKLDFKEQAVGYRYDETSVIQDFSNTVSEEVKTKIKWSSSDNNIIKIVDGKLVASNAGSAVITALITQDKYYESSSATYSALVYKEPLVKTNLSVTQRGVMMSSPKVWQPVYTDDKLLINWSLTDNSYSPAHSATVIVKNASGNVISTKNITSTELDVGHGQIDLSVNPANVMDKTIKVETTWVGFKDLTTKINMDNMAVAPADAEEIYTLSYSVGQQLWHNNGAPGTTSGHVRTSTCTGSDWAMLKLKYALGFKGTKSKYLSGYQNPQVKIFFTKTSGLGESMIGNATYRSDLNWSLDTSRLKSYPDYLIQDDCRNPDSKLNDGTYSPVVSIKNDYQTLDTHISTKFRWNNGWDADNQITHLPETQPWSDIKVW